MADWVLDEQPVTLHTRSRTIVSVPYTVDLNDVVISAVQHQPSDEIFRRGRDQFERLHQDGAGNPRVMAISIHPLPDLRRYYAVGHKPVEAVQVLYHPDRYRFDIHLLTPGARLRA